MITELLADGAGHTFLVHRAPSLWTHARAGWPEIAVVFASGDAAPLLRGDLAGSIVLSKPYDATKLIAAVRTALGEEAAAPYAVSGGETS